MPASQRSTAKERFAAFVDSLDTKGKCSNNQDRRGRSRGRSSSPAPGSNNSRRERPSSAPPGRPAWGVRSLTSEAIFNKYDSMETLALRSMKSAARTRYSRSPSLQRPGIKAKTNPKINTRRYSMLSPPRKENNFSPGQRAQRQDMCRKGGVSRASGAIK